MTVTIAPAAPGALDDIRRLLRAVELPTDDLGGSNQTFLVARSGEALVGVVGLELYGTTALLRSLAVDPSCRGDGLGRQLTRRAVDDAAARGVHDVVLLTMTAAGFFEKNGFTRVAREEMPEPVRASAQFKSLCPATAVCMRKWLAR